MRPHRLEAQDTALSRRQHGFESRWGRHIPSGSCSCASRSRVRRIDRCPSCLNRGSGLADLPGGTAVYSLTPRRTVRPCSSPPRWRHARRRRMGAVLTPGMPALGTVLGLLSVLAAPDSWSASTQLPVPRVADGSSWSLLDTPGDVQSASIYDPVRRRLVAFGGVENGCSSCLTGATWTLDLATSTWSLFTAA